MDRDDCLDDGLKWRGRVSDGSDSDDDVFGLYAERTRGQFDDFVSRVEGLGDSESDEYEDEDDPLGGLVTIGNLDHPGSVADASDGEPSQSAASDDFMKHLEEIIERDMPKVKITDEYQKVLDAVDASEGGLVGEEDGKDGKEGKEVERGDDEQNAQEQEQQGGEVPNGATHGGRSTSHEGILDDEGGGGDPLPDLGAVLGRERKDRDVETLEELIGELDVDENADREKQRRGTFFDDDGVIDIGNVGGSEGDVLDGI